MVCRKQSCRLRDGTQIESLGVSDMAGGQSDIAELGHPHVRPDIFGVVQRWRVQLGKGSQLSFRLGTAVTNLPPQPVI